MAPWAHKAAAQIDSWAKTTAPSNELRKWYQHDPEKRPEFKARYFAELEAQPEAVAESSRNEDGVTMKTVSR